MDSDHDLNGQHPSEILRWAWNRFAPKLAMSSSFQSQSVPLLHLVSRHVPEMTIFFLDTGFHFPETLRFRDQLVADWGLRVKNLRPEPLAPLPAVGRGMPLRLFEVDPDRCCAVHKVEPLRRAMKGLSAWVSGIRRDQTEARSQVGILETRGELVRVHPMATWTSRDVWNYINENSLPVHPLLEKGYMSVGCEPCTEPSVSGAGERSGRWSGREKTECGLHSDVRSKTSESGSIKDGRRA